MPVFVASPYTYYRQYLVQLCYSRDTPIMIISTRNPFFQKLQVVITFILIIKSFIPITFIFIILLALRLALRLALPRIH